MNTQYIKLEFKLPASPNCRRLFRKRRRALSALRAPGSRNIRGADSPIPRGTTLPTATYMCRVSRFLSQGWLVAFLTVRLGTLHGQQQGLSELCRYQETQELRCKLCSRCTPIPSALLLCRQPVLLLLAHLGCSLMVEC